MTGYLRPYAAKYRPTAFLDVRTARGVRDDGTTVRAVLGGRRTTNAQTVDYLETARAAGVERIYLVGARPTPPKWAKVASDWLLLDTPGWSAGRHHFDAEHPVGRFTHDTGATVQLRRASEWFGDVDSAAEAREAWELLRNVYAGEFRGAVLFDSPNGTAQDAFLRTLPRDDDGRPVAPEQLPDDIAELVHSTSPQNRVEMYVHDDVDQVPGFVYYDARFAYASMTRELGCAPVVLLDSARATALFESTPYTRARYRVTFKARDGWAHVGLLMCKNPRGGWFAPWDGETWCDGAELHVARAQGWHVDIHQALVFTKGRPLDTWTDKLHRMREAITARTTATERARDLARRAVRTMLVVGIGGFHSRGYRATRVYRNALDIPPGVEVEPRGDVFIAHERIAPDARGRLLHHPEWSSQVWGRAHARLLDAPTGTAGRRAGALHVPFRELLGMRADALYLTVDPRWPDDGKPGRYRLAGALPGPLAPPRTPAELNELRRKAAGRG